MIWSSLWIHPLHSAKFKGLSKARSRQKASWVLGVFSSTAANLRHSYYPLAVEENGTGGKQNAGSPRT